MTNEAALATFSITCAQCNRRLADHLSGQCSCGGLAEIRYPLETIRLQKSHNPYARFGQLLPVVDHSLLPSRRSYTPTVHATRLGRGLGLSSLYLKDETALPSGSTKDRMADVALAFLWEHGVRAFCTSSTGNSSTAFARAISRFADMRMFLFTADDFHDRVQAPECEQIVHFVLRGATFVEAAEASRRFANRHGMLAEGGFFNPARREGLKLAWYESVEQVDRPIDWYVQAVSSAMGVQGVLKGAHELMRLGCVDRLPRPVCVQQDSCAPMVSAWNDALETMRTSDVVAHPTGIARSILRGDSTRAYPHVRRTVLRAGGTFVAVSEQEIRDARQMIEELEGIHPCFSASAALAGVRRLAQRGDVQRDETVLVNLTGRDRTSDAKLPASQFLERRDGHWSPIVAANDDPSTLHGVRT